MKIYTPGPVYVRPEILAEMGHPPIEHRSKAMRMLLSSILPKLREVFGGVREGTVFTAVSSGTGLMEAAVTNTVPRGGKILNLITGTFGERWHAITMAMGREGCALSLPLGQAIAPQMVEDALRSRSYDAITLTHNETSTGVLNPLGEIASVVKQFENVLFLVDAVSSFGGAPVEVDRNSIDFAFSTSQKCLAMPAGLALGYASDRCVDRARSNPDRGFYFDIVRFAATSEVFEPAFTPPTSNLFALRRQLEDIAEETLPSRFLRHRKMMDTIHTWVESEDAQRVGFSVLAEPEYRSPTVTVVLTQKSFPLASYLSVLSREGYVLGAGIGQIAGNSFRVGHMGDLSVEDVQELTKALTESLRGMKG